MPKHSSPNHGRIGVEVGHSGLSMTRCPGISPQDFSYRIDCFAIWLLAWYGFGRGSCRCAVRIILRHSRLTPNKPSFMNLALDLVKTFSTQKSHTLPFAAILLTILSLLPRLRHCEHSDIQLTWPLCFRRTDQLEEKLNGLVDLLRASGDIPALNRPEGLTLDDAVSIDAACACLPSDRKRSLQTPDHAMTTSHPGSFRILL